MSSYERYTKTLGELRRIGAKIPRILCPGKPYEVDIERIIEEKYGIVIDIAPLKAESGVEGYPAIGGNKIFIDMGLADKDYLEKRYRFTLAEELAHVILHKDIYKDVETVEDYFKLYQEIPDEIYDKLDKNAKELAGIILMPEDVLVKRIRSIRKSLYEFHGIKEPNQEQRSTLTYAIEHQLAEDFNVSDLVCGIRVERTSMYFSPNRDLFEI